MLAVKMYEVLQIVLHSAVSYLLLSICRFWKARFVETKGMKKIIALEEMAITLVACYFITQHTIGLSLWVWALLFFVPDISIAAYLVNAKAGAIVYNIFHHRALALVVVAIGWFTHNEMPLAIGILLFAHASFDRMFGYGLKYKYGFGQTHLGFIGKKQPNYETGCVSGSGLPA
jgi:hypothetical protein